MLTGKELKVKRIILDIKAKEIAEVLGVSKVFVSNMEKGVKKIPKDKYLIWADYLGVKYSMNNENGVEMNE